MEVAHPHIIELLEFDLQLFHILQVLFIFRPRVWIAAGAVEEAALADVN